MKSFAILIATLSVSTASIATAAPVVKTDIGVNEAGGGSPANAATTDKRRYCVADTVTGSRLPMKQCKTRSEWARDGVDVDQLGK